MVLGRLQWLPIKPREEGATLIIAKRHMGRKALAQARDSPHRSDTDEKFT